jgi:putative OPT family oligopeptide transporter
MVSSIATYKHREKTERTEKDLPFSLLLGGGAILALLLVCFFSKIFGELGSPHWLMVLVSMGYIFFAGFLFSVVTAYFSGMVGVSASPGSAVMIAGIVMAAWVFLTTWNWLYPVPLSGKNMQIAQAIVIMLGSMMMSIVAIANDNSQDLKVGQLVGATPYKQQWMLLLGVFLSAIVIPPVMEILFQVYGIAGVFPREGMDPSLALPAPTAAVMATITQAMFMHTIPWAMLEIGAFSLLLLGIVAYVLRRKVTFSILGIAVGMYLPLSSSVPLFLGGAFALLIKRRVKMRCPSLQEQKAKTQKAVIIACGLVAGSALMDVLLAIPFSLLRSPELLSVVQPGWEPIGVALSLSLIACLPWWINRRIFQ